MKQPSMHCYRLRAGVASSLSRAGLLATRGAGGRRFGEESRVELFAEIRRDARVEGLSACALAARQQYTEGRRGTPWNLREAYRCRRAQ